MMKKKRFKKLTAKWLSAAIRDEQMSAKEYTKRGLTQYADDEKHHAEGLKKLKAMMG